MMQMAFSTTMLTGRLCFPTSSIYIFPLHFAVFRSVAPCITVEANNERLFLFSGRISDPNMSPSTLSKCTYIVKNADLKPPLTEIKAAYCKKYKSFVLPTAVRFRQKKPPGPGAASVTLKF
jgi:hypothetical protein